MKTYHQLLPVAYFLSLILLSATQITPQGPETEDSLTTRIDSIAQAYMDGGKVTGISIAVLQDQKVLYNRTVGHADLDKKQPLSNQHYFLMASISKLVGSTVVMKLVEEGKLSLDQTLAELLPDFPRPGQAQKIKLRHLLSHTSGLQDYAAEIDSAYIKTRQDPTKADYYGFLENHDLLFEPGSNFAYSNSGYLLMAMIVERITGQDYQSEVNRIINQPADVDLQLIALRNVDPLMAPYYELNGDTFKHIPHWTWIKGDGGLTATSLDLARFAFKWTDGSIISKNSLEQMSAPTALGNGMTSGYGLGVRTGNLEGEPVIGHTGGNKSFKAVMQYYPQRNMSVVVMVNTDNTTSDAFYIAGFVALAALDKPVPNLKGLEVTLPAGNFEGDYKRYGYGSDKAYHTIYKDKMGRLYRKTRNSKSNGQRLYHLGDQQFAPENFPMDRIIFETDAQGEVLGFNEYYNGFFFRAPMKLSVENAMSDK